MRTLRRTSLTSTPETLESEIAVGDSFSELLYARGFMLTHGVHTAPVAHWREMRLGCHWLSYDPRSSFAIARAGRTWVAILGRAICTDSWNDDLEKVALRVLRFRRQGRDVMQLAVDNLSGRYAVIDGDQDDVYVQSDAAGMRAIFYGSHEGGITVGSHANLVAEYVGNEPSAFPDPQEIRREHNAYAIPGRLTPFARVYALTPNTELGVRSGQVRRVFPREPLEQRTTGDVVDEVLPILQRQISLLARRTPLVVSLTAGLDSRTTLALTRQVADGVEYFTYDSKTGTGASGTSMRADVEAAQELARVLGLSHHRIPLLYRIPPEPLAGIMSKNSPRISSPGMAATHRQYHGCRGLHVRSNLYEIGRAFYRSKRQQPTRLDAKQMAFLLTNHKETPASFAAGFEEFIEASEFESTQEFIDPYDLYYWEHRCGTWLNAHHAESDIVYDTFTLVNSRRIFTALLSVPLEERISGRPFIEMITRSWPEVLKVPVNGVSMRPD